MHLITFFLAFLGSMVAARESDYCLANDLHPYLYFGSKSAYTFMHGKFQSEQNCKPIQIFVVSRHGTRYPRLKSILDMQDLFKLRDKIISNHLQDNLGHLCDLDLQNLQNWQWDKNVTKDMVDFLSPQGEADLKELAIRLKNSVPDLFNQTANDNKNSNFVFRSTKTQRTETSMAAFMEGLLGSKNAVTPIKAPEKDTLLLASKECFLWNEETKSGDFLDERNKFNNGLEMQSVLYNVRNRLGFVENLTLDSVITMYDMCRFNKAWRVNLVSPWCAAFSKEDLEILEYREDLDYYYYAGPGRKINSEVGYPLIKDMFEHFRKLEGDNNSQEPKGIFYFGHSVTLHTLMSALGFHSDSQPLLATNFKSMADREYRTSLVGSFATNFVAVFYKCRDVGSTLINKVSFHWAEKMIKYEGCKEGLCDWDYIKRKFGKKVEECTMAFCYSASGHSILSNFSIINIFVPLFVLLGFIQTF